MVAVYYDHTTIRQAYFVCQQSIVKKELVVNVLNVAIRKLAAVGESRLDTSVRSLCGVMP